MFSEVVEELGKGISVSDNSIDPSNFNSINVERVVQLKTFNLREIKIINFGISFNY